MEQRFDAAIVMGGLHHCVADLGTTLANIAALLKPGAPLMMFEPNREYVLQFARDLWYRVDGYFDAATRGRAGPWRCASPCRRCFPARAGAVFRRAGLFLIYNSLVFRMPHGLKRAVSPPLMAMEAGFNRLPGKRLFSSFTARWRRG